MTIAEAKNALGVNPEESRQLRNAFYQTLKADHFTSKLEAGEEHWKELKSQWINSSQLLQTILAPGNADPQHQEKVKAMEVLCRDVMKRLRDDQTKRDPTRKRKPEPNFSSADDSMHAIPQQSLPPFDPGSDANPFQASPHHNLVQTATRAQAQSQAAQSQPRVRGQAQPRPPQPQQHPQVMMDHSNMQIDPSLLLAAANDPSLMNRGMQNMQNQFSEQQYADQQYAAQAAQAACPPSPSSIAVYFRLHPSSDVQTTSRLWVSTLSMISVDELRQLAVAKFPGTIAIRVEGVFKQPSGHEMTLPIDSDEELQAYLAEINGVKPIFTVQLVAAWKNG
jgi:hypothetical protein